MNSGYKIEIMGGEKLYRAVVLPIALIIVAYIGYIIVDNLSKITAGFSETGWYLYGVLIIAIAGIISYNWYDLIRSGFRY
jgi:hypothetical protein